jgi:hypothetical protein
MFNQSNQINMRNVIKVKAEIKRLNAKIKANKLALLVANETSEFIRIISENESLNKALDEFLSFERCKIKFIWEEQGQYYIPIKRGK